MGGVIGVGVGSRVFGESCTLSSQGPMGHIIYYTVMA